MSTATHHPLIETQKRLDYLDGVRAFALILGIIFHASLSFLPIYIGWAVMDINTSSAIGVFMMISHSFRMELFFLIAGFFSHMTVHKKGLKAFLASRLVRIAVPFIVAWFILRPLLISGWIMGAESLRGDVNISAGLISGFATLGELPKGLFVGTHLWFLYYLLIITTTILSLSLLIGLHKPTNKWISEKADNIVRRIANSDLSIFVLAIPTLGCLWFMSHWGMDTPDKSLKPEPVVFAIYAGFFAFGWLLHRQDGLIEHFAKLSFAKIALCIIAIICASWLTRYESQVGHAHYLWLKAAFLYCYACMMWTLVALSIGIFKRFLSKPSKLVRYLADASYWLYLIHLPIVVWLQIAFAELNIHWLFKLGAVSTITIGISLLIYDLMIRSTFVGSVLNGKRKARIMAVSFRRNKELAEIEP
jgi:glucan biosynthesis protein C